MLYIVTIKTDKNQQHDPANKRTGKCAVNDYCTDTTGQHHSFVVMAETAYQAEQWAKATYGHVTRVEDVGPFLQFAA